MRKGKQTTGFQSTSNKGRKKISPSILLVFTAHSFNKEKKTTPKPLLT